MILRLCLFLLMFALALPATAAPLHCASGTVMSMATPSHTGHGGDHEAPKHRTAKQDCNGCIAPFTVERLADDTLSLPPPRLKVRNESQLVATHSAPDTPPPRS